MLRRFAPVLLSAATIPTGVARAQDVLAITNVGVITMADTGMSAGRTVVVRHGRVAVIGPARAVSVPEGARVIDGSGKYLIPGLIDMHVHASKRRASALGLLVGHGVTTVRDQGGEPVELLRWRREIRAGTRVGPRMLIAGPNLEPRGNIERMRRDPPESRVEPFERARIGIGSAEEARRVVDSLAALELDHLKIRTAQDRETYVAIGAAADARGLRLVGHVATASPAVILEAGQDGIDHPLLFPPDSFPPARREAFWRELARRDVAVVPTLNVFWQSVLQPPEYYRSLITDTTGAVHPLRPYLSRFLILDWREQAEEQTPQRRALFRRYWPTIVEQVKEFAIAAVVVRGRAYNRAELDRILAGVRSMPDLRANDWTR